MKKTLITILALSGMAMAADSDLLFASTATTGSAGGSYGGFVFTLSDNSRMDLTGTLDPTVTEVQLNSIEVMVRSGNTWAANDCMYIIDGDKKLIAVSEALTSNVSGGTMATFTFLDKSTVLPNAGSNAPLTIGGTYYAFLGTATNFQQNWSIKDLSIGDTYNTPDTNNHQIAVQNVGGADNVLDCGVVYRPQDLQGEEQWSLKPNSTSFSPVMKISTSVIVPEPATATLSLLALAGLAARRRRH